MVMLIKCLGVDQQVHEIFFFFFATNTQRSQNAWELKQIKTREHNHGVSVRSPWRQRASAALKTTKEMQTDRQEATAGTVAAAAGQPPWTETVPVWEPDGNLDPKQNQFLLGPAEVAERQLNVVVSIGCSTPGDSSVTQVPSELCQRFPSSK